MASTILIVDDEPMLTDLLSEHLKQNGYLTYTANNSAQALEQLRHKPDLILLDINMPGTDGLELCKQIRSHVVCPILFLTARITELDQINGFQVGGDDYIIKPFSLKELEARVLAHLRREERHQQKTRYRFGNGLLVDYGARAVWIDGKMLDLTKTAVGILEFLSMHPGQVFDKERIYEHVCGFDGQGDGRGITELIRRIRKKIGEFTDEDPIETVWGVGYRWKK